MNIDEIINHYKNSSDDGFSARKITLSVKNQDKFYQEVMRLTDFITDEHNRSFTERLHIIRLGIKENPSCVVCGNPTVFVRSESRKIDGVKKSIQFMNFRKTCSTKCMGIEKTGRSLNISDEMKSQTADKRKATMLEKYGYEVNSQRPEIKPLLNLNHKSDEYRQKMREIQRSKHPHIDYDLLDDRERLIELNKTHSTKEIANIAKCSQSLVQMFFIEIHKIPIKQNRSYIEIIIKEILDKHNIEYFENKRSILPSKKELDFYIPSKNLAIECNGLYWHSEKKLDDKEYHLKKTEECESLDIQLLHFFENEIVEKTDIVESMILSKLGLSNRIYARQCTIKDVQYNDYIKFCIANHLQGFATAKIIKGLYYQDELVCLMSLSKPRFNGYDVDYELVRFATKKGYTVIGGFSKLIKLFSNNSIMSYANRRWSMGNVYTTNGFKHIKNTDVGFFYFSPIDGIVTRYADRRPLNEVLNDGFIRIFDCGNMVFVKNN